MKRLLIFLVLPTVWLGCSPEVISEYDARADFSLYRTFMLCEEDLEPQNPSHPFLDNRKNRQMVYDIIVDEMESRGYAEYKESPDLIINFDVAIEEKTKHVKVCANSKQNEYWPQCWIQEVDYSYGTMILQMSDNASGQIVFEAAISDQFAETETINRMEAKKAIKLVMDEYPFRAAEEGP